MKAMEFYSQEILPKVNAPVHQAFIRTRTHGGRRKAPEQQGHQFAGKQCFFAQHAGS
jgi:hypothetical protein